YCLFEAKTFRRAAGGQGPPRADHRAPQRDMGEGRDQDRSGEAASANQGHGGGRMGGGAGLNEANALAGGARARRGGILDQQSELAGLRRQQLLVGGGAGLNGEAMGDQILERQAA